MTIFTERRRTQNRNAIVNNNNNVHSHKDNIYLLKIIIALLSLFIYIFNLYLKIKCFKEEIAKPSFFRITWKFCDLVFAFYFFYYKFNYLRKVFLKKN